MYKIDTSDEVQKIYDEKIRSLSEEERFLRGISLTSFSRQMCLAGIFDRYPGISLQEAKVKMFEGIYGDSFSFQEKEKIRHHLIDKA